MMSQNKRGTGTRIVQQQNESLTCMQKMLRAQVLTLRKLEEIRRLLAKEKPK